MRRDRDDRHAHGPGGRVPSRLAVAVAGGAALTVQVVLLRELMASWHGNEMSFGIALSVWLLSVGLGSSLYTAVGRRVASRASSLAAGLLILALLAPSSLLLARAVRASVGPHAGEVVGFAPLVLASLAAISPFAIVSGFLFSLATSVLSCERTTRSPAGTVYAVEALGAALSGIIMSFVLLPLMNPVGITLVVSAAAGLAALALVGRGAARGARRKRALSAFALLVLCAAAGAFPYASDIDDATVGARWSDLGYVRQANSIHGRIVATRMGSQSSLYESGVLAASWPDRLSAEEIVHIPMLMHPGPTRVLLLGGGLGGAIEEILKHPDVAEIDYVELDPELIRTASSAFGEDVTSGLADPRVRTHFVDARLFVKRDSSLYDVVIVAAPDPTTARLSRFYTADFLRETAGLLAEGGVVGLSVRSAANYISPELAAFLAGVRATAAAAFGSVVVLPGDPCHVVASDAAGVLTRDPDELGRRVEERRLDVVHVRDYYLADRLSEERTSHLDAAIDAAVPIVSTDLLPTCYYQSLVLWNREFAGAAGLLAAAPRFVRAETWALVGIALVVLLGLPAYFGRNARARRAVVVAAVVVVGATEMSLEVAALVTFQSIYGYAYHQLALIVAAFMAGLAAGGWVGTRAAARGAGYGSFALLQLAIAAVPLGFAFAVTAIAGLPQSALSAWAHYFPALVVCAALLAGMQFPIAARLVTPAGVNAGAAGGRLYAADLAGAALGATAAAVLLIPVAGTVAAMHGLAFINLAAFVCLLGPALRGGSR